MPDTMEDRRLFTRLKVKFQLKFMDLASGKEGEAETVDISANGVGFITKEILSVKAPLEMWLVIPDHHEPLYTRGEVAWAESLDGDGTQRVGVHIINQDLLGLARVLWVRQQK